MPVAPPDSTAGRKRPRRSVPDRLAEWGRAPLLVEVPLMALLIALFVTDVISFLTLYLVTLGGLLLMMLFFVFVPRSKWTRRP